MVESREYVSPELFYVDFQIGKGFMNRITFTGHKQQVCEKLVETDKLTMGAVYNQFGEELFVVR